MTTDSEPQPNDTPSDDMPPLKVDPARASALIQNITSITTRISQTCKSHNIPKQPRLVAVSKLKPATDILALHSTPSSETSRLLSEDDAAVPEEPQIHFGENYVQELIEKSRLLPRSIRWHFIGGLQSNKATQLARDVKNLWAVESVDSDKKAKGLEKGRKERNESLGDDVNEGDKPLRVFVQLNTSGEESKSGVEPKSETLTALCKTIINDCPNLKLQGLMTIGAIARSQATTEETENEDFISLRENRDWVAEQLKIKSDELELSMGMSEDFEGAIVQGSSEVRVGSTIFGARPPRKEAKVLENAEEGKK